MQAQLPQAQAQRSTKRKARGEASVISAAPGTQHAQQQAAAVKQPEADGPGGVACQAAPPPWQAQKPSVQKAKAARAKEGGSQHSGSLAQPVTQRVAERPAKKAKVVLLTGSVPPASQEAAAAQHVRKGSAKKARAAPRAPADAAKQAGAPQPAVHHVLERPAKKAKTAAPEAARVALQAVPVQPAAQQGAGRPAQKAKKKKVKAAHMEQARQAEPHAQPEPQQPSGSAGLVPPAPLPSAGGSGSAAKSIGFLAALQAATRRARADAGAAAHPAAHGQAAQPDRGDAAGGLCRLGLGLGSGNAAGACRRGRWALWELLVGGVLCSVFASLACSALLVRGPRGFLQHHSKSARLCVTLMGDSRVSRQR